MHKGKYIVSLSFYIIIYTSSKYGRRKYRGLQIHANARSPYGFVLAAAMLRIFGSDDERSGLAGVYTFKSSDRYFGYAIVHAVGHRESIL